MARRIRPVDGLLADLRGDGERDAGEFTLDPRQAAEKLRQFQLADPYHYVLLLAEAAFVAGCTFLIIRVSSREVTLEYDAPPADLENLFALIFTTRQRPDLKALGLGLNAALRLSPQSLTVECGSQRLHVEPQGTRVEARTALQTWRIALRHRVGWRLFKKVLHLSESQPEAEILRTFCRWAPASVQVNGADLRLPETGQALMKVRITGTPVTPLPWKPSSESLELKTSSAWEAVFVASQGDPQKSEVDLVINGVWAGRRPLPNPHLLLQGAVSCPALERNLSRTDVVDTPECQRLLRQLKLQARDIFTGLLRTFQESFPPKLRPWLLQLLKDLVRAKDYDGEWSDEPRGALIDIPFLYAHDGRTLPCRSLLEQYRSRGSLLFTHRQFSTAGLEGLLVVMAGPSDEAALRRVFTRWEDAEQLFRQQAQLEEERAAFLARPVGPAVLADDLAASVPTPHGELGLGILPGQPWCLLLGREGRLLGDWKGPRIQLPAGVLGLAYHEELTPGPGWSSAAPSPARTALLVEAQAALPALYSELVRAPVDPKVVEEHLTNLLDYLARSGKTWPLPLPAEVLEHRWLPEVRGQRLALAELQPPVAFLLDRPLEGISRLPRPTLLLTPAQLRVLRTLMGKRAWHEAGAGAPEPPLQAPLVLTVEPFLTELSLPNGGSLRLLGQGRGLEVMVLNRGQLTQRKSLGLPIPRCEARWEGELPANWKAVLTQKLQRMVLELARRVAGKRSQLKGKGFEPYLLDFLPWVLSEPHRDRARLTELAILPGAGGQRYTLDELEKSGPVQVAEQDPGPCETLVLVAPRGTEWLLKVTEGRAVWLEPAPQAPESPRPDVASQAPPSPPPEPPADQETTSAAWRRREEPSDEAARRLLRALRGLLDDLEPRQACRELQERLYVGQGVGLVTWEGGEVRVNLDHPWVRRLVLDPEPPMARLALVLSASFSVFNRALAEVADHEERRFHRSLLGVLA